MPAAPAPPLFTPRVRRPRAELVARARTASSESATLTGCFGFFFSSLFESGLALSECWHQRSQVLLAQVCGCSFRSGRSARRDLGLTSSVVRRESRESGRFLDHPLSAGHGAACVGAFGAGRGRPSELTVCPWVGVLGVWRPTFVSDIFVWLRMLGDYRHAGQPGPWASVIFVAGPEVQVH